MGLFSDDTLRARQTQLNSQWNALNETVGHCGLTPSSGPAFSQFYADLAGWREFFDSESDWTSGSKHATDEYQTKLQDYTKTLPQYCGAGDSGESAYIPGVKDPPKDQAGLFDQALDVAAKPFKALEDFAVKIGIGLGILILVILGAIIYLSTHAKFKGYGAQIG